MRSATGVGAPRGETRAKASVGHSSKPGATTRTVGAFLATDSAAAAASALAL